MSTTSYYYVTTVYLDELQAWEVRADDVYYVHLWGMGCVYGLCACLGGFGTCMTPSLHVTCLHWPVWPSQGHAVSVGLHYYWHIVDYNWICALPS